MSQNKLPSKISSIKKVETLAENFVLLDSLLFKLVTTPDKETELLAIPEICVDKIIALYHVSLFVGHQCVVKTYLTMKEVFHSWCDALLKILYKRMSYMPASMTR